MFVFFSSREYLLEVDRVRDDFDGGGSSLSTTSSFSIIQTYYHE